MPESEKQYVIGMDCGTSNMKAIILDNTGEVLAEESRPVTSINLGQSVCYSPEMSVNCIESRIFAR